LRLSDPLIATAKYSLKVSICIKFDTYKYIYWHGIVKTWSYNFFLQNAPFGNFFILYATFLYILPVRETFFPVFLITLFLQVNLLCCCRLTYFKNACKCMKFQEKIMQTCDIVVRYLYKYNIRVCPNVFN